MRKSKGVYFNKKLGKWYVRHRIFLSVGDFIDDFHGYYDTEEEANKIYKQIKGEKNEGNII